MKIEILKIFILFIICIIKVNLQIFTVSRQFFSGGDGGGGGQFWHLKHIYSDIHLRTFQVSEGVLGRLLFKIDLKVQKSRQKHGIWTFMYINMHIYIYIYGINTSLQPNFAPISLVFTQLAVKT